MFLKIAAACFNPAHSSSRRGYDRLYETYIFFVSFKLYEAEDLTSKKSIDERRSYELDNELCDFVRETAFAIHRYHKHGHLEKVYENALAHRLRKAGLNVEQQFPLKVFDEDGTPIGEYFADLIIEDTLIVELKACRALS